MASQENAESLGQALSITPSTVEEQKNLEQQLNDPFVNPYAVQPSPVVPTPLELETSMQPIANYGQQADISRANEVVGQAIGQKRAAGIPIQGEVAVREEAPVEDASQFAIPQQQKTEEVKIQAPSDDYIKNIEKQSRAQQAAYDAIGNAARAKGKAQAEVQNALSEELAGKQAQFEQKRQLIESDVKQQMAKLDQLAESMASQTFTADKIDPNRANPLMSDDWTQRLTAALAIGLGATAGNANPAMNIINSNIERDILAQKENIANSLRTQEMGARSKEAASGVRQNMLQSLQNQFGNELRAEEAYRVLRLEQAQQKLNAIGSQNNAIAQQEQFKIMSSQVAAQLENAKMQFAASVRQQAVMDMVGRSMDNPDTELPPSVLAKLPKELVSQYEDSRKRLVPVAKQFAKDPEAAKKFSENATPLITSLDSIDEIMKISKGLNKFTDFKDRALIEARLTPVVGGLRLAYTGPGVLTETEQAMIRASIGDPSKITDFLSIEPAKLKQTQQILENALKRHADVTFANSNAAMSKMRPKLSVGKKVNP